MTALDADGATPSGRTEGASVRRWVPEVVLIVVAIAFGSTFVVVKDAVEVAEPTAFLAVRFAIGAFTLGLVQLVRRSAPARPRSSHRRLWRDGGLAGGALCIGYLTQTVGLQYTTATVSALLTYLLVLFVPLMTAVLLRNRPATTTLAALPLAILGLWLLTGGLGTTTGFGRGEVLTVACAIAFAGHIVALSRLAPQYDAIELTAVQLAAVAAGMTIAALSGPGGGALALPGRALAAAVYTGIVASAFAFVGQTWAQRHIPPSRTALLLLIEPVAAAFLGSLIGERLGLRGWFGAAAILGALVIAELGPLRRRPQPPSSIDESSELARN